jgi:hypothetical protein
MIGEMMTVQQSSSTLLMTNVGWSKVIYPPPRGHFKIISETPIIVHVPRDDWSRLPPGILHFDARVTAATIMTTLFAYNNEIALTEAEFVGGYA